MFPSDFSRHNSTRPGRNDVNDESQTMTDVPMTYGTVAETTDGNRGVYLDSGHGTHSASASWMASAQHESTDGPHRWSGDPAPALEQNSDVFPQVAHSESLQPASFAHIQESRARMPIWNASQASSDHMPSTQWVADGAQSGAWSSVDDRSDINAPNAISNDRADMQLQLMTSTTFDGPVLQASAPFLHNPAQVPAIAAAAFPSLAGDHHSSRTHAVSSSGFAGVHMTLSPSTIQQRLEPRSQQLQYGTGLMRVQSSPHGARGTPSDQMSTPDTSDEMYASVTPYMLDVDYGAAAGAGGRSSNMPAYNLTPHLPIQAFEGTQVGLNASNPSLRVHPDLPVTGPPVNSVNEVCNSLLMSWNRV